MVVTPIDPCTNTRDWDFDSWSRVKPKKVVKMVKFDQICACAVGVA